MTKLLLSFKWERQPAAQRAFIKYNNLQVTVIRQP